MIHQTADLMPTLLYSFLSHHTFFKTILASRTNGTFGFFQRTNQSQKTKRAKFSLRYKLTDTKTFLKYRTQNKIRYFLIFRC